MDEEKKVEAVRDFYAHAAENRVAFASAERMLFLGKFICFGLLVDLMMNFMMELMMGLMIGLMIDLMMDQMMDIMMDFWTSMDFCDFSPSWSPFLHPCLQRHLLGIRAHHVHGGQLTVLCKIL